MTKRITASHAVTMVSSIILLIAGCGQTVAPTATTPTISGSPVTYATVGTTYQFLPKASGAEGDTLQFSVANQPAWSTFDATTGLLSGTPGSADVGAYMDIQIRVTDGKKSQSLGPFSITVDLPADKAAYGHYFATHRGNTLVDVATLCEQAGVRGVVWRRTWNEVESTQGVYDFTTFDEVLAAIAGSHNPQCQLWILVEHKSFGSNQAKNPCPVYLQQHSGPNGNGGATCFMWEPAVYEAYIAMLRAAAARYDSHPRVEGIILQESALGFTGPYTKDSAAGGTYTGEAWRDALVQIAGECGAAFKQSRCLFFLNFIRNGQRYLHDVSRALAAIPQNRGCMSGPDLLPDERGLYADGNSPYEVLARHSGCRSNSAQTDSFHVPDCGPDCIFNFAVRGTFGDFDQTSPRTSGLCVNSYLFWTYSTKPSATGIDWTSVLPVIAAYPYGPLWLDQCQGSTAAP
jgi:hypothetical protein